jgi:hypothetical protein
MAFRFPFRRRRLDPLPAVVLPPSPPRPSVAARLLAPLRAVGRFLVRVLVALDRGFAWLAVPFGVGVRDPVHRYARLLGLYAVLFALGALPFSLVSLPALAAAYIGVLAIGRAWVLNEKERTAIVKKLKDTDPDLLPDLRGTALVSALMLLILFPLTFQQVERFFHLFKVHDGLTFWSWLWFSVDKTYLKALPDWSILYGVHISSIDFDAAWGRHLVLLSRLTFDFILIQGLLRLLAIRATIREAVAVVKVDPHVAVRLGKRALAPLIEKLQNPDKVERGAAANALMQLGDNRAIQLIGGARKT